MLDGVTNWKIVTDKQTCHVGEICSYNTDVKTWFILLKRKKIEISLPSLPKL